MKKCEMCFCKHDGEYGSGRFCSPFCSRKFSTKDKRAEINKKVSLTVRRNHSETPIVRKEVFLKTCPVCHNPFETWKSVDKIYCSKRCYSLDKNGEFRNHPAGGYRKNSGRGKCGYYQSIWCQSTYELAYVIFNIDHGIVFNRNNEKFKYINSQGEEKKYLPDFVVGGEFVEIKGFHTADVDLKASSVNKPIRVLYKKDLKYAFDYVQSTYGLPLLQLYDNYKPAFKYRCVQCGVEFHSDKKRKTSDVYCSRSCAGSHSATKNLPIKSK